MHKNNIKKGEPMMKKISEKPKNNTGLWKQTKGITLIALVITIIVLLILAAVSISMLAGDNGILKKAVQAKEVTEHSQIEEEVSMVYMEVLTDHYHSNNYEFATSFQEKLRETNNENEEDTVTYDASNEMYRIYYKGYFFEISTTSGNVTTNRQEEKDEISDALSKIESDLTADNIQQQLPNMVVTEDPETGKIVIEGNESTWEVDPATGEITEAAPKDVTPPEVTLTTYSVTSKSITVEATATDYESGLLETDTYRFYIADSQIYPDKPTATNTTGTYTFENLDTNVQYYIKVEVEDQSGNVGTAERSEITQLIPSAETAITRNITWSSDGTATVALSTSTEYTIQYGTDSAIWNNYENMLSLQNGEKVYIVLTDGRNYGESYQLTVEDNDPPAVTVTGVAGSNYITAKATAIDTGAGVSDTAIYHYYIKKDGEDDSSYQLYDSVASSEYTFTGLTANTRYVIKVTTTDLLGNEGEGLATVPTSQFVYVTGNIEFSNVSWSNGTASVNIINNKTEYRIQYQIIEPEEIANDSNWIESTANPTTLSGLANGTTVLARLYDGTNATTDYATCNIQDNTAPQITEVTKMPEDWTNDSVTLTITAVDNESGLAPEAYSFDGGANWQTSNQKTYTENTSNIAIRVRDKAGIITSYIDMVNITNIDKLGPVINAEVSTKGEEVTIEVTSSTDAGVGLADNPYNYYISNSYDDLDSTSPSENLQKVENSSSASQTFTTVVGTTYYIKVEVKDQFGNASKVYRTITAGTLEVDENALQISGVTWNDEKASVEISKTVTEYNIEYQVVKKGETFNLNGTTVQSQMNKTPMASINWYQMYLYEDSNYASNPYYGNSNIICSMITGSQWDTMLNYILTGSDAEDVTAITGNHTGTRASTGQYANDIMNNIFDLSSNVREWTQEANSTSNRVNRGGNYNTTDTNPASNRNNNNPTNTNNNIGSRLAL